MARRVAICAVAQIKNEADIWYQRLSGVAPFGLPVQVTVGSEDDQLNDVSGDYIVYTAYEC